jgi:primosomal protein N' (replication factor Y)
VCYWGCIQRSIAKLLLESDSYLAKKQFFVDPNQLSDDEFLVYEALQQSSLKISSIISILNKRNIFPVIQKK